ncbi:MAG: hypothetical protein SGCHY_000369 [Lobulomycetales sp.]
MKRAPETSLSLTKKAKPDATGNALIRTVKRTSSLSAPIMQLTGHEQEVFSVSFSPDGQLVASASMDRHIFLWNTFGDCSNFSLLKGHQGAVLETCWGRDNQTLYSCSADMSVAIWSSESSQRLRKLRGHTNFVNAIAASRSGGQEMIASVSDDNTCRVWDPREKNAISVIENQYQLTAVTWAASSPTVFTGGIDNTIRGWDLRNTDEPIYALEGHADTISGLRASPDGTSLLSNSFDNTLKLWDIRPFAAGGERLIRTLQGAPQGFEKNLIRPCFSADGDFIACGSADRSVVVWYGDRIVYKLPGHKGCVNHVDWHPVEPVIASCSSDRTILLGELDVSEVK